jgi:DNA topoisomerase III
MRRLFIAEKPSLARAITEVLPAPHQRRDGYYECGDTDLVAWCAGHILELAAPDAYDAEYKQWRLEHLPIVPGEWKLTPTAPDLLKTIKSLLPRASVVVNAGDPDREGQLLVDEVLAYLGYRGPVDRILVNDLNPTAVRKALAGIQPNAKFRPLYEAALGRQRADWLYGLNMTRLYTGLGRAAGYQGVLSVGRVQTPLLGLIVRRDLEIERFVPKPYYKVFADVAGGSHPFTALWQPASTAENTFDSDGRLLSADVAAQIVRKTSGQQRTVTKAACEQKVETAPLPYSLAELQVDAGRRLGRSPKQILEICQALYETHRLTTYPRSDCSYLPEEHLVQAPDVHRAITLVDPSLAGVAGEADLSLRSRAWTDAKVTAHHAVIPTPRATITKPLSDDERIVYNLIARRYLAQFFPPFEYQQLEAEIMVAGERFVAKGRQPLAFGWRRAIETAPESESDSSKGEGADTDGDSDRDAVLPPLHPGQELRAAKTRKIEKQTKPPRRFTASSLVQAMTGIARYVSSAQIKQLLRETDGIGTPATQASIIQTLFDRGYVEEGKRQVVSTATGRALIRALPDVATQPDLTALWEAMLRRIQDGHASLSGFLEAVRIQLGELVERAKNAGSIQIPGIETRPCAAPGCSGCLRLRVGNAGKFWACSRYPDCRQTASAESAAMGARSRAEGSPRTGQHIRNRRRRKDRHEPTSVK